MTETASDPTLRALRALRAHAPELTDRPVRPLGQGLDNVAFVVDDLVVRVADGHDVRREAGLLDFLAPRLPIPVPAPVIADEGLGVLGYRLLPGRPLLGRVPPAGAAAVLGRFLRELHAVDPAAVAGLVEAEDAEPADWLEDLDGPAEYLRILRGETPPPSAQRVLAHADLGAEHLLDDGTHLTGVIDWSDAALTDPALDFARIYRDFGPTFLDQALDAYGGLPDAEPRILFFARCAALEDFAYGSETGHDEYAAAALRSFDWLFPA